MSDTSGAFRSSAIGGTHFSITFRPLGEAATRAVDGLKAEPERPPARQKPSGRRSFTRADLDAGALIEAYDRLPRKPGPGVLSAFKKAARQLSLGAREVHAVDCLVSYLQPRDWEGGPLVVWPSNAQLSDRLDLSKRGVQNLLTDLKEKGLVAFADSPQGKRWGRRDEAGRILEAYGIDLRPLAARAEEFQRLARRAERERKACGAARRRRTVARKSIEQVIRTARELGGDPDAWDSCERDLRAICTGDPETLPLADLEDQARRLEALAAAVRADLHALFASLPSGDGPVETAPSGEAGCTLITTTTESESLYERQGDGRQGDGVGGAAAGSPADTGDAADGDARQRCGRAETAEAAGPGSGAAALRRAVAAHLEVYEITPGMVLRACPEVAKYVPPPRGRATWNHLAEAGSTLCHILGINRSAWVEACAALTPGAAGAAVAIIAQKRAYGLAGLGPPVAEPGGYLRWFARAAGRGVIDLGPKVYKLLDERGLGDPERGL